MKIKDYIIVLLIVFVVIFMNKNLSNDSYLEIFKEITKREDILRDSLQKQHIKINDLSLSRETKQYNYYYDNEKVDKYLENEIDITKKDSSNCMPIINSLFDCKDLLFSFQKSSLELNHANDSLVYALKDNLDLQKKYLKLKDRKFEVKPNKRKLYITVSGSLDRLGFEDIKLGGFFTTKKRFAFGYQHGFINKSHEAKIGYNIFKN